MSAGDWKLRAPQRGLSDSQSNCSLPVHTTAVGPEDPLCCLLLTPVSAVCFSHLCQLSVSHTGVGCLFLTPVSAVFLTPVSAVCFSHQCKPLTPVSAVSHTGVSCVLLTSASAVSHTSVSCLFLTPVSAVCFSLLCSCLFLNPVSAVCFSHRCQPQVTGHTG